MGSSDQNRAEDAIERLRKALEAAVIAAGFGQLVEPSLSVLDLGPWCKIHRCVEGDVDHVLADPDQVAAQRQLVDRAPVILGVDDGGGFGGEAGQVLADRHAADVGLRRQEGLQRDRGGDLAHPDQAAGGLEDGLVDRLEIVFRLQEVRYPVERVVIDQDRTEQGLFRLDVVRRTPIGRSSGIGGELEDVRIKEGHCLRSSPNCVYFWEAGRARIKRLSGGKRKRKLVPYAPLNKMWMILGLGVREA